MKVSASKIAPTLVADEAPKPPVPPANDNVSRASMQAYIDSLRAHAGCDYQPASTKMWWLP